MSPDIAVDLVAEALQVVMLPFIQGVIAARFTSVSVGAITNPVSSNASAASK